MNLHQANILIVDDDKDVLTAVRFLLKMEVKTILTETNPDNIHKLITENDIDIILLDMNFRKFHQHRQRRSVLAERNKETETFPVSHYDYSLCRYRPGHQKPKEEVADFIVKPWHNEHLLNILSETLRKQATPDSKEKTNKRNTDIEIIGNSESMQLLFHKLQKIAPTDANILILGENGTGKDLVARYIYQSSLRRNQPFVK